MRIISQDGRIDVPYEMIALNVWKDKNGTDKFCVYMHSNSLNAKGVVMATYSTEEKAMMVMEMLSRCYMDHTIYKTMTQEQREVFIDGTSGKEQERIFGIFQFPSDEEVEG